MTLKVVNEMSIRLGIDPENRPQKKHSQINSAREFHGKATEKAAKWWSRSSTDFWTPTYKIS
jgi:hypothetical protein